MFFNNLRTLFTEIVGENLFEFTDYFVGVITVVIAITVLYLLVKLVSPKDTYIKRLVFTLLYTSPFIWLVFQWYSMYASALTYYINQI